MSTGKAATFTAGLVQMRSGLSPQANLDAAVRLIEEATRAGADYVLTPEMTNILEVKRERLFAAIAPEEKDATLAAFRELARKLGIFLHVGSLAIKLLPEKAANRSFLIDRKGDIEPGVILAVIDPAEVTAARAKIPSLQHGRRFEIIEPMAEPAHLHAVRGPA